MAKKARKTEVNAYHFILENLKELGWKVKNPARFHDGQVYTQNECLSDPEIQPFLQQERPENIVKITESLYWVIEAKSDRNMLDKAVSEAEDYAKKINRSKNIQVAFISGVAGNDADSYLIQTRYLVDSEFRPILINGKEISALLSPEIIRLAIETKGIIQDLPIDEALFLAKASEINEILHLGAINKNTRARVIASLLLSIIEEPQPNVDASPSVLIREINSRAERMLKLHDKGEFFKYIEIALPPTEDNHVKFKTALVQTIRELNNLNIRSAMNSGADVLGKFYEVFLKYGNGAKEIGIVLTPRHITKFAVDVLNITNQDVVFDPTCGTGGFLVAAFDYVKQRYSPEQVDLFKQHGLFGIEQEAEVVALALVNMIFRGDGKNNITEGNCFAKNLERMTTDNQPSAKYIKTTPNIFLPSNKLSVTRVLMNPPFALKRQDEKEFKFVDYALGQMAHGGILFCVLPYSVMAKPKTYLDWRKNSLLANNTLLSVVTFPSDLFYPVGVHTVGIFVKKGIPHHSQQNVLWIRAISDGFAISKGKRLPNTRVGNDLQYATDVLRNFILNPNQNVPNILRFQKASPIDYSDPLFELVPENYLDQSPSTNTDVVEGVDEVVRSAVAFLINSDRFSQSSVLDNQINWQKFQITDILSLKRGDFHSLSILHRGDYPTVSRVTTNNGVVGYFDKPDDATIYKPGLITVSTVGGDAFVQLKEFIATDNVVVCKPKFVLRPTSLIFITFMINQQKWRYSYGRQCYINKLAQLEFYLPILPSGDLDEDMMAFFVRQSPYWSYIENMLSS